MPSNFSDINREIIVIISFIVFGIIMVFSTIVTFWKEEYFKQVEDKWNGLNRNI